MTAASTLFDVPAVKEALFLLLGGGLDEAGKEKWLAARIDYNVPPDRIFGDALRQIEGMVAT